MTKKTLRVRFVPFTQDISLGTYRIWVHDYCSYMQNIGIDAAIIPVNRLEEAFKDGDIIILGKGGDSFYTSICEFAAKNYPNTIVGTITPPATLRDTPFDFVMAGSPEEADSLAFNQNTIINAHIESLYWDIDPKKHTDKSSLVIGVHGWSPHLGSFVPNLKWALEEYEKEQKFELRIICENENFNWTVGRPEIENISFRQWDFSTITENILECDIGLIPGITDLSHYVSQFGVQPSHGLFDSDYIFRLKNKCNNGRSLVFHYLGVPVIADFSPSHFHLLGGGDCGYLANTKEGWLYGLRKLKDYKHRNQFSTNAYSRVKHEYNPYTWAQKYYDAMETIYNEKRSKKL